MPEPAFSGVYAATPTPLVPDGSSIDPAAIDRLTEYLVTSGCHGLVVGGSTGEFTALDLDERKLVTEAFLAATDGRLPVVAGTGALTTVETVELSVHAAKAGAGAVMVAPPYYDRPSSDELVEHLRAVVESVDVPTIYYHMPSLTGVELDADGSPTSCAAAARPPSRTAAATSPSSPPCSSTPTSARCSTGGTASRWRRSPAAHPPRSGAWRASSPAGAPAPPRRGRGPRRPGSGPRAVGPAVPDLPGPRHGQLRRGHQDRARSGGRAVGSPRRPLRELAADDRDRLGELLRAAGVEVAEGAASTPVRADPGIRRREGRYRFEPRLLPAAGHFVDGRPSPGTTGRWIDVVDPSRGTSFTTVAQGSAADVDRAVAAALRAQPAWAARVPKERSEVLHAVASRVEQNAEDLAVLESANTGKPFDGVPRRHGRYRRHLPVLRGCARAVTSQAAGDYAEDHLSVIVRSRSGSSVSSRPGTTRC